MSKRVPSRAAARGPSFAAKLLRFTAASAIFAGIGFAALTAAGHLAGSDASLAMRTGAPTSWRDNLKQAEATQAGQQQYLFSRSLTFNGAQPAAPKAERLHAKSETADRFDAVVAQADLSPDRLRKAFTPVVKTARIKKKVEPQQVAAVAPVREQAAVSAVPQQPKAERFQGKPTISYQAPSMALAYAGPDQTPAAQALHDLAEEEARTQEALASLPDATEVLEELETPAAVPLPTAKPKIAQPKVDEPEIEETVSKPEKPEDKPAVAEKPSKQKLRERSRTYVTAREDKQQEKASKGLGFSFRDLFGGSARAGKGVAVYDISAKKVYMPDGTVLTAYSGMGKMANNPKYTHVRMNGPTPVHTYNLKMREKLFHGVRAIRMLPVDGRNKHGRDGFLAHSQLVRGQQSHGCVAFPQYDKFLRAFQQGKVKQIVVVASGGRAAATRTASN